MHNGKESKHVQKLEKFATADLENSSYDLTVALNQKSRGGAFLPEVSSWLTERATAAKHINKLKQEGKRKIRMNHHHSEGHQGVEIVQRHFPTI